MLFAKLIQTPGVEILRSASLRSVCLRTRQVTNEWRHDRCADFVLKREEIRDVAIVGLTPDVRTGFCIDEIGADANAVVRATHSSLHDVANVELRRHALDVDVPAIPKARATCDHRKGAPRGQQRN